MRKSLILGAFLFLLTGCATTISTNVERPAELDLNGAKSLAVLPFQPAPWKNETLNYLDLFLSPRSESFDKMRLCEDLTDKLTKCFYNSEYMKIVNSQTVQNSLKNSKKAPCDVYITGYLQSYDEKISHRECKDDDRLYLKYQRSVSATVVYEIIEARTGLVYYHDSKIFSGSSSESENRNDLESGYSLIRHQVDSFVKELSRKIQPYTVTVSFSLLEDKTKDPEIKAAHEAAKDKHLETARTMFLSAYERTDNFECAYNAAIITEALQEYDEAERMMNDLYMKTYDKRASKALAQIKREKEYDAKLKLQNEKRR